MRRRRSRRGSRAIGGRSLAMYAMVMAAPSYLLYAAVITNVALIFLHGFEFNIILGYALWINFAGVIVALISIVMRGSYYAITAIVLNLLALFWSPGFMFG